MQTQVRHRILTSRLPVAMVVSSYIPRHRDCQWRHNNVVLLAHLVPHVQGTVAAASRSESRWDHNHQ
jgi:hypothetical protein